MDNSLEEFVKYLKAEKNFSNFMKLVKNKYEIYESSNPGKIVLKNATEEEKKVIGRLLSKNFLNKKDIIVSLIEIQIAIDNSRFEGVLLKNVVENYFDTLIITNKNLKIVKEENFNNEIKKLLATEVNNVCYNSLKILFENKKMYTWLKMLYNQNSERFKFYIKSGAKAINNLPIKPTRLSVFASLIYNEPHALDIGKVNLKIFNNLLIIHDCKILKENINKEYLVELYYKYNILIDEVSNMVLCKNLIGYIDKEPHSGWLGFYDLNESIQITLENLNGINSVKCDYNFCLVVENPSVFMSLSNYFADKKVPLVCTYGQVKLAGKLLLNLLTKNRVKIIYSGDLDPEGIKIADNLKSKYKECISFIGFNKECYLKNKTENILTDLRINKLNKLVNEEFFEIKNLLQNYKNPSYEEENIEYIIEILIKDYMN